jgi:hypothetical protein
LLASSVASLALLCFVVALAVKKAVEEKKVSWRVFNPDTELDRPIIPTITEASPIGPAPFAREPAT